MSQAISCIASAIVLWVASSLAGTALAEPVDQPAVKDKPLVKKARKVNASKAKPDKNQYWLLNPVPPDQMRSFSTDRPTKSNVPYTVDAGHFQYETDLVNFTHQVSGTTRTDTLLVPNPTFKVGVTNNVDLEFNVPFAGVRTYAPAGAASNATSAASRPSAASNTISGASNTASAVSTTLSGIGDTFVRSKINLWGNDGGDTAAAIIPYVKVPRRTLASATARSKVACLGR